VPCRMYAWNTGPVLSAKLGAQGQRIKPSSARGIRYVPYSNQDELPIFDSGLPDLN